MSAEDYMSTREAAEKWGMSMPGVLRLCKLSRVPGSGKVGHGWIIPKTAQRPPDERITTGKWVGYTAKRNRKMRSHN